MGRRCCNIALTIDRPEDPYEILVCLKLHPKLEGLGTILLDNELKIILHKPFSNVLGIKRFGTATNPWNEVFLQS